MVRDMEAQHENPTWWNKADSAIGAYVTDPVWSGRYKTEQLAAKEVGLRAYVICCIPFLLYGINLGDTVEVDDKLNVKSVVKRGDHFGFRIATQSLEQQETLLDKFPKRLGIPHEHFSENLLAVDAEGEAMAKQIKAILQAALDLGQIIDYEQISTTSSL